MGRIIGIVVVVAVAIGVIWMKLGRKDDQSKIMHENVLTALQSLPDYKTHEGLYLQLVEEHHKDSFDHHYTMGGRRSSGRFDVEGYLTEMFSTMAKDAERQGYKTQAKEILELRSQMVTTTRP
ncbi:MAG: hypothetical protein KF745_13130 [Phycisphaeraceae bacterium]|nr:hypothetical protein [Phycisphaeraceae bacterium]